MTVGALAILGVWLYLAFGRGGFWRGRENDRAMHATSARAGTIAWPHVVAIVPARDEVGLIGATVTSLLEQDYPGSFELILVDDHSADGTAAAARTAAAAVGASDRLTVLPAPPLPAGWTGKLWALSTGVAHCNERAVPPDLLLFTDADIHHGPGAVAALVSSAVAERLVLSSLMVALRCESFAERTLIPAFVFFFQMLYPFAWVNAPSRSTAAAAGGCVLLSRRALAAAGGIAAIRGSLIDDCALARALKPHGRIRLALGGHVRSLRPYPTFESVRRMVVRSAYAQLRFSPWLLIGVACAMTLIFVAPILLSFLAGGWTRVFGIASWILMSLLYMPTLDRYRVPLLSAFALPLVALVYLGFTLESALQHALGRGGVWKGRVNTSGASRASSSTPAGPVGE